ncbi:unnamed protein product [Lathyrus sativus]|nr:unnamed protein product [Lathyrus sativus]
MATGSIYVAVPALAAAVGFYFIDTNHIKEIKKEFSVSNNKMKDQEKTIQHPKMAPQLDGLHCFETIVMN